MSVSTTAAAAVESISLSSLLPPKKKCVTALPTALPLTADHDHHSPSKLYPAAAIVVGVDVVVGGGGAVPTAVVVVASPLHRGDCD